MKNFSSAFNAKYRIKLNYFSCSYVFKFKYAYKLANMHDLKGVRYVYHFSECLLYYTRILYFIKEEVNHCYVF